MAEEQRGVAVGSVRLWEILTAAGFLAFGAIVIWDSRRLGSQWGSDGPQAGYFPFYIGVIICIASVANLVAAVNARALSGEAFVRWDQLKLILTVVVPSLVYVAFIANPWLSLGIYVSSAIFIAFFMRYLAHYSWGKIAGVSIGTMLVFFVMFEIWFKVPLPKGPLEAALGFQ